MLTLDSSIDIIKVSTARIWIRVENVGLNPTERFLEIHLKAPITNESELRLSDLFQSDVAGCRHKKQYTRQRRMGDGARFQVCTLVVVNAVHQMTVKRDSEKR